MLIDTTFKSPQQGAATQVWAATSPRLAGMGGVYCEDCDVAAIADSETAESRVRDRRGAGQRVVGGVGETDWC